MSLLLFRNGAGSPPTTEGSLFDLRSLVVFSLGFIWLAVVVLL
jgi:hypothetical protein